MDITRWSIPKSAAAAKLLQLCLTLHDPIDGSPSGSPVPGILQARTLGWVPFPSPMRESEVAQSCLTLCDPMGCSLPGSSVHGIFQARVLEWGAIAFSNILAQCILNTSFVLQFISVIQLFPTICNPVNCSMPGFPVHHQLLEPAQTHVRRVGGAIQLSHSLLSPSPAFSLSQHQGLFQ